jgi:hypothetical protein
MGDYRNELQSALAQVEALRAENAALRARGITGGEPHTANERAATPATPSLANAPRKTRVTAVAMGLVLISGVVAAFYQMRTPHTEHLSFRDAPVVPAPAEPPQPLPMPAIRPTSSAPSYAAPPSVDRSLTDQMIEGVLATPVEVHAPTLRWSRRNARSGLLVLTTVPEAECSVGGVIVRTPYAVSLPPGLHVVHCTAGDRRSNWRVRVEANHVTFDTEHIIGRWF